MRKDKEHALFNVLKIDLFTLEFVNMMIIRKKEHTLDHVNVQSGRFS